MPTPPTIAFLVLTYRRPESLLALLESVERQRLPDGARSRIVVWDNDGDSASAARVRRSRFADREDITYRTSDRNWRMVGRRRLEDAWFAEAPADPGDWIVHLDDDVVLADGWLEHGLAACRAHGWDACGSVEAWRGELWYSGQHTLVMELRRIDDGAVEAQEEIGADSPFPADAAPPPAGRVRCWRWRWQPLPEAPKEATRPVVFAGHRALLVSAPRAREVRHDDAMTIGGEDLDYSLALRRAGATLGISHRAVIEHRPRGEEDAPGFRRRDHVVRSWRRFHDKWGFLRLGAAREAGMEPRRWLELVCRP